MTDLDYLSDEALALTEWLADNPYYNPVSNRSDVPSGAGLSEDDSGRVFCQGPVALGELRPIKRRV